jgi:drug/metabolite transporter (DMT)-like permease
VAAAAVGVQVGAATVVTRFVVEQSGPATLAFLRYLVGFACLLPFVLRAPRVRFARADLAPIAALGIVQFAVLIALLNIGLRTIPAGRAALILATMPLLTMLLSAALGRERLGAAGVAGVVLTFAGVALVLAPKAVLPGEHPQQWIGNAVVLAGAASGAACSVFYRPYLVRYPTLQVSAFAMLCSVAFLAVPAGIEAWLEGWPRFDAAGWGAVAFIGISSGVGYYLWLWALARATPTRVTVFLALSPLTAGGIGALWLGEALTVRFGVALACVAAGLWLAQRRVPAPAVR